jgi:hypothetical protein
MKKYKLLIYFIFSLFIIFIVYNSNQKVNYNILYGKWIGKQNNKIISLTFNQDQTCEFVIHNFINRDSIKIKGNFEIDFSKTPIPLSIRNISNLDHALHTIISLKNNNELRIGNFGKRWKSRPIAFDYNKNLILKKEN